MKKQIAIILAAALVVTLLPGCKRRSRTRTHTNTQVTATATPTTAKYGAATATPKATGTKVGAGGGGAVTLEVTGTGTASSLNYNTAAEADTASNVSLPWRKTATVGQSGMISIAASGTGTLTCKISQAGKVLATKTASKSVTCSATLK
ncbi:hypothetical protein [Longispora albida]|uniref:hypothetical protein n=1 Tax=Longispora albida TaxID=203523 RepID=UPI000381690B|nr:hypothetical protein [Longispora albida]